MGNLITVVYERVKRFNFHDQIAKKGLANLIRHEVIHQRLSECLKPTLSRISQYQTLDLQLLNGAAVALELVPEWFNQADGEKLLEHLRKWIDPDAHNAVQRPWPLGMAQRH